jgi:hypothetical protein
MMTTEGWTYTMYKGIDAIGVGMQPIRNSSKWASLYFITFLIIGYIFLANLFVGVVIDDFNLIKEKEEMGNMMVNEK